MPAIDPDEKTCENCRFYHYVMNEDECVHICTRWAEMHHDNGVPYMAFDAIDEPDGDYCEVFEAHPEYLRLLRKWG